MASDKETILELKRVIEYALGLLTDTPPQFRREMHATARAALRKAIKNIPNN